MRKFVKTKTKVYNRGVCPDSVLNEITDWAIKTLKESPEVFKVNPVVNEIYPSVKPQLGPWTSIYKRAAAMCEVLRVLGGFESSWDWLCGRDESNPTSNTPCTEESGMFQCSGNAMDLDPSLKEYFKKITGKTDCKSFIVEMKKNHELCIGFTARLLRVTVNHHGPVKRKEINKWLNQEACNEFESFIRAASGPVVETPTQTEVTPLALAKKEIGVHEIEPGSTARILEYHSHSNGKFGDDDIPWCASFCNAILDWAGYDRPRGELDALAATYKEYGVRLNGPEVGCIIVFRWVNGGHHVAFCSDFNADSVLALGGNQSDAVNEKWQSRKFVVAYRRPIKLS